jgi:hypothetical protein
MREKFQEQKIVKLAKLKLRKINHSLARDEEGHSSEKNFEGVVA